MAPRAITETAGGADGGCNRAMKRRAFIGSLACGTAAMSPFARAHAAALRIYRIGILASGATTDDMVGPQPRYASTSALLRGLREVGYVYGEHFVTEPRGGAGRPERYPDLAAELVRLQVDVIVAAGPMLAALKQTTSTIPVVMAGANDPEGDGLAQTLGRPGGNFTGLSNQSAEVTGKRLELLKEFVPTAVLVAVLRDRTGLQSWQAAEGAAHKRGWKLLSLEVTDAAGIEGAVRRASDAHAGALLVSGGGLLIRSAHRIAELATKHRLPAMYPLRLFVEAGGLICYSANLNEIWRRSAAFVDKILKGAKAADLPIEQPSKFELVINLKTAKLLGLTIPPSLQLQADELIQ
jgi:putative ABC transport system substrate-binding protein